MKLPKRYQDKYNDALNKKFGTSKPKTWSGKGGSTSRYGGNKLTSKVKRGR